MHLKCQNSAWVETNRYLVPIHIGVVFGGFLEPDAENRGSKTNEGEWGGVVGGAVKFKGK